MAKNTIKRLPPFRAPYYFDSGYLGTAASWNASFTSLLREIMQDTAVLGTFDTQFGDWTIRVRFENIQLVLCARTGLFLLEEFSIDGDDDEDDEWKNSRWMGPSNSPHAFQQQLLHEEPPEKLRDEVKRVSRLSEHLIERMDLRLRASLKRGEAVYEARPGAVGANFARLSGDQLQGLKFEELVDLEGYDAPGGVEYEDLPDATGRDGTTFFSLCIVPIKDHENRGQLMSARQDRRVKYDPRLYEPVIKRAVHAVKKQFGQNATQAEAKRRSESEFELLGLPAPGKTVLEQQIKKFFHAE